ncbi:MAG TPA: ATP synthase subunit I [Minicystis sp.]|nr:ATP synthase subunit I [Minicystis sp.]
MVLESLAFVLLGALAAAAYCAALAFNARLYLSPRARLAPFVHVARTVALVLALVGLARAGAAPLLAALAGFAIVHMAVLVAARGRA